MKSSLSRKEAEEKIDKFFKRKIFSVGELKKTKRIAMKFNIKLKNYRKLYCKKCLSKLKGEIRIMKDYKTVKCFYCGFVNRHRIKYKELQI